MVDDCLLTGQQLLIKRIEQNIKGKDIAKSIGIAASYISMMEKGKVPITRHIYKKWANELGLNNENENGVD